MECLRKQNLSSQAFFETAFTEGRFRVESKIILQEENCKCREILIGKKFIYAILVHNYESVTLNVFNLKSKYLFKVQLWNEIFQSLVEFGKKYLLVMGFSHAAIYSIKNLKVTKQLSPKTVDSGQHAFLKLTNHYYIEFLSGRLKRINIRNFELDQLQALNKRVPKADQIIKRIGNQRSFSIMRFMDKLIIYFAFDEEGEVIKSSKQSLNYPCLQLQQFDQNNFATLIRQRDHVLLKVFHKGNWNCQQFEFKDRLQLYQQHINCNKALVFVKICNKLYYITPSSGQLIEIITLNSEEKGWIQMFSSKYDKSKPKKLKAVAGWSHNQYYMSGEVIVVITISVE